MAETARFNLSSLLSKDEEREVGTRLRAGALVIYPTDTLYAIGCLALHGDALQALRAAKGRDATKALPVIAGDLAQAQSLAAAWPREAARLAEAFWPGPLTLIVPKGPHLPLALLAGESGVAVRVPAFDHARRLARLAGPLVSTSANHAGETPCTAVDLAMRAFPQATLVFDAGILQGAPSTIVDLMTPGAARIMRAGRIDEHSITTVLNAST